MSQVEGEKRTNKLSASPDLFNETERRRLADAFWEIYDKYQDEMDKQALCEHVYGILFALMERPDLMKRLGDRFFVNQERKVFFIDSRSNETNRAVRLVSVKTNAEFEENLKQELQTNQGDLERQEQQLVAELDRCDLVAQGILQTLLTVEGFPDNSPVKKLVLPVFNNLHTDLQRLQVELELLENQEQVVIKKAKAKKIGDWLLNQIK